MYWSPSYRFYRLGQSVYKSTAQRMDKRQYSLRSQLHLKYVHSLRKSAALTFSKDAPRKQVKLYPPTDPISET